MEVKQIDSQELIKICTNDNGITLSARELHEFLEIKTQYTKWFDRMKEYGFEENVDYRAISQKSLTAQGNSTTYTDHEIKLDMAKEIAMIQRNDKGKQARRYFLQIEKAWNSPEMVMKRALEIANKRVEKLQLEIKDNKPKVIFADAVAASKSSILVGELAKLIKQNGIDIGQNRLFEWLRNNGYIVKRKGSDYNSPTQKSMDLNLLEVKERAIPHADGHITLSKTPKVTGKGQQYFINKFLEESKKEELI